MDIDLKKISKIGIDRIVLNNFKIKNFEELEKKEIFDKLNYIQKVSFKDDKFELSYCTNFCQENGEEFDISFLEFNPIKLMTGFNVYNANITQLKKSISYVEKVFNENGIVLDLSEAKIKELELNITLPIEYSTLSEVITLLGKANKNKCLGIYMIDENETSIHRMKKTGTFYLNSKRKTGKTIKIYDKKLEANNKNNYYISQPLTRVEVLFGRDYFREVMLKRNMDNSLQSFLKLNTDDLKELFSNSLEQELVKNVKKALDKIENNLKKSFYNFRRTERSKRKERDRLKKLGKEIPNYLKEERGVFRYLEKNNWIFDISFLTKICISVESKNKKSYMKQLKNYTNINNLSIYHNFITQIFN